MNWLARLKRWVAPDTHPTEPTKPGFVGFVGTPDERVREITGKATPANDPASDPDRWAWPHSSAMNGREINTFMARLARFTDKGLDAVAAERLADLLVVRDREQDDRRLCLECGHLQRAAGWRCGNWGRAGVAIRATDAELCRDFVNLLQRCDGFAGGIYWHDQGGEHGQA